MIDSKSDELAMIGITVDLVDYLKKDKCLQQGPPKEWETKIANVSNELEG